MQSQSKSQQSLRKMTAKWVLKFAWKYNRAGIIKRHLKKERKLEDLYALTSRMKEVCYWCKNNQK